MPAVTRPIEAALKQRCDAWGLRLDKLSFDPGGDARAKAELFKAICAGYEASARPLLELICQSRHRLLGALKHQHGDRFGLVELLAENPLLLPSGRGGTLESGGLCVDRPTGLPWIPGAALKPMVPWDDGEAP